MTCYPPTPMTERRSDRVSKASSPVTGRAVFPIRRRFGKVNPTPATAVTGFIGEFPWFRQFADTDEGNVDAAGGHSFSFPIESVTDGGFRINVEGFEHGDFFPVG